MARKKKQAPTLSPQVVALHRFVDFVREGRIVAMPEPAAAQWDLDAVVTMIDEILRGADPQQVLGLGDRRQLATLANNYYRDHNLAVAVLEASESTSNLDDAIEQVSAATKLGFDTVRDAYYDHKDSARALLDLKRTVGTNRN